MTGLSWTPDGESLVFSAGMILMRTGMGILFAREFTREALEQSGGSPSEIPL